MKKVLGILLVLGLFCSTASAVTLGLYGADGTSTTVTAQVGDTVQLKVFVEGVSMLAGFDTYIEMGDIGLPGSGAVLELVQLADYGDWFSSVANDADHAGLSADAGVRTGLQVTALMNPTIDTDPLTGFPLPEDQWKLGYVDGNGDIATFYFKAAALGTIDVSLDVDNVTLGSDEAQAIPYDLLNGTVTVNVVPEPLTMTLLASGLLGLVAYRRRK